jgi:glycosyltransferase involved in cell wall biosynthesis
MRVWMPVRLVPAHGVGGGMERVAWTMAEGLAGRGHEVTIVTTAHPDGRDEEEAGGVRVRYVAGTTWRKYQPQWWSASYRWLCEAAADVVLSQSAGALGYIARAREALGVATVPLLYGSARNEWLTAWRAARSPRGLYRLGRLGVRAPRLRGAWQRAAPHVERWLAVSDAVATDACRELRIARERLSVLPPGIDTHRFRPDAEARRTMRARLGIGEGTPVVVSVGRLEREKGVDTALAAAALARRQHPDLRLLIAGVGHDEVRLRRRASENDVFLGLVGHDDLPAVLAAADIFVFSSRCAEGRPVSVLEAAAAGLPVVERRDPAGLAAGLGTLLDDPAARQRLGQQARARAVAELSPSVMVHTVEQVLDGVQGTCRSRR